MIKFLTNQKPGFVLPKIKAQRSKKRNVVGAAGIGLPLCPCTGLQWEKKDSCFKSYETTLERVSNRSV